jgi:hypothetical protein
VKSIEHSFTLAADIEEYVLATGADNDSFYAIAWLNGFAGNGFCLEKVCKGFVTHCFLLFR